MAPPSSARRSPTQPAGTNQRSLHPRRRTEKKKRKKTQPHIATKSRGLLERERAAGRHLGIFTACARSRLAHDGEKEQKLSFEIRSHLRSLPSRFDRASPSRQPDMQREPDLVSIAGVASSSVNE